MWCLFISFISFWTLIFKKKSLILPIWRFISFRPSTKNKEVRGGRLSPWVNDMEGRCHHLFFLLLLLLLLLFPAAKSPFIQFKLLVLADQPRDILLFLLKALLYGFLESSELLFFSSLSHDTFAGTWAYFSFHPFLP